MSLIRKTGYWLIPFLILLAIAYIVDFAQLKLTFALVNPWVMLSGVLLFPVIIFIGVFRWKIIVQHYLNHPVELGFICKHYWIGLALGRFLPTTVTWDIYRVVAVGKRFGNYTGQTAAVLLEKVISLIVAVFIILLFYPFINKYIKVDVLLTETIRKLTTIVVDISVVNYSVIISVAMIALATGFYFIKRLFNKKKVNVLQDVLLPVMNLRLIIYLFLFSVTIYFFTAVANYLFFYSLETPLPLAIHFALRPVFSIIFLLPVSFAGFGIREGSYILLYGLFGVSMETALVVSFMNFIASLLNTAIGGVIMLMTDSKAQPFFRHSREGGNPEALPITGSPPPQE